MAIDVRKLCGQPSEKGNQIRATHIGRSNRVKLNKAEVKGKRRFRGGELAG
jgi:hypothetical protein